jgi:hypothetical protein
MLWKVDTRHKQSRVEREKSKQISTTERSQTNQHQRQQLRTWGHTPSMCLTDSISVRIDLPKMVASPLVGSSMPLYAQGSPTDRYGDQTDRSVASKRASATQHTTQSQSAKWIVDRCNGKMRPHLSNEIVVVLPAPLWPSSAKICPSYIERVRLLTATCGWNPSAEIDKTAIS